MTTGGGLPRVSVVMPVYNHEIFVERAIRSVAAQSGVDVELILIDDGSTDDSFAIARKVTSEVMPSARLIRRPNKGAHQTINEGLRLASGDFLTILNSDDVFLDGRLKTCAQALRSHNAHFVFTGVEFYDEADEVVANDPYVEDIRQATRTIDEFATLGFALLKSNLAITTGNFFFSRELYRTVGGFRHYRYVHDWDFLLRVLFEYEPIYVPTPLYGYRVHGSNTFRSLADVVGYETSEVMRNCMHRLTTRRPPNQKAPSRLTWPGAFDRFVERWGYQGYMPRGYHASSQ